VSLPIRARLTIWYVALLAAILAALGGFVVVRLRADLMSGVDDGLDTRAAQISLGLQGPGEGEFQDVSDASLSGLLRSESAAQLLASDGAVLESSGDPIAQRALVSAGELGRALGGERVRETVDTGPDAESFRILAVRLPQPETGRVIVVATSLEGVDASVHRLLVLLLVAGPAALAAAGAGGWWLARTALAPVAEMTREASEIGMAQLDERIDVPVTADELGRLATTLNAMLDRLQRGVEEKRRFVADASHDLRTPLAVMRSELDVSLRSPDLAPEARTVLTSVRDEVERMGRIVENLLTLARIDEGGLELLREPLELRLLVDGIVASMGSLAAEGGVDVQVDGDAGSVRADRMRMEQVVTNLLGNALRYAGAGGRVRVSAWRTENEAGVTVSDTGPGIATELLPRIFERFVRADTPRTGSGGGSGLGLAICREVLEAHGGRIWVDPAPGGGSSFSFALPIVTT
jgi:two-component system, OmpR family, sensor kinase